MQLDSLDNDLMPYWQRFLKINQRGKLAQAILLVGSNANATSFFSEKMAKFLLCLETKENCNCKSCHLFSLKSHPDLHYVLNEKLNDAIKIEQIRALQSFAYASPNISKRRIIVINPAEKMNRVAANALLKLLEEPPESLEFILIAEEISFLPATIISRCQQWPIQNTVAKYGSYLSFAEIQNSEKSEVYSHCDTILDDLISLKENKTNASLLAQKWNSYEFSELIGLLYLINAQLIGSILKVNPSSKEDKIQHLSTYFEPHTLFSQLDKLNQMMKQIALNFNFNQTLSLENLLFSF
ncbi:MAG: hypothetical protein LCH30_10030 [Proteobacteria bacterium]|nr:hypothetical protein [Pseudomonadota bacterium]